MISFAWGAQNLWMRDTLEEPGSQKWTFGQVIALLVLVAPILASAEGYLSSE